MLFIFGIEDIKLSLKIGVDQMSRLLNFYRKVASDYEQYPRRIYGGSKNQKVLPICFRSSWQPPHVGCVKIDADVSVNNDGWIGMGVMVHDYMGEVLFELRTVLKHGGL